MCIFPHLLGGLFMISLHGYQSYVFFILVFPCSCILSNKAFLPSGKYSFQWACKVAAAKAVCVCSVVQMAVEAQPAGSHCGFWVSRSGRGCRTHIPHVSRGSWHCWSGDPCLSPPREKDDGFSMLTQSPFAERLSSSQTQCADRWGFVSVLSSLFYKFLCLPLAMQPHWISPCGFVNLLFYGQHFFVQVSFLLYRCASWTILPIHIHICTSVHTDYVPRRAYRIIQWRFWLGSMFNLCFPLCSL